MHSRLQNKLSGRLKKRRPKKRIKAIIKLLFGTNTVKADEILSDFSKGMIIRFFYRRKPSLPYACTATRRFSTLLHLFYLFFISSKPGRLILSAHYYRGSRCGADFSRWATQKRQSRQCGIYTYNIAISQKTLRIFHCGGAARMSTAVHRFRSKNSHG